MKHLFFHSIKEEEGRNNQRLDKKMQFFEGGVGVGFGLERCANFW